MTMAHVHQTIFYIAQNVVNVEGNKKCSQKAIVDCIECLQKTMIAAPFSYCLM